MFCEQCGKELVDPDLYCEHCGTPLPEDIVRSNQAGLRETAGNLMWNWVNRHKMILIVIILLATLITAGFMAADYLKTVIDPTDYISVQLSGYNARGTAAYSFDENCDLTYRMMGLSDTEMKLLDEAYESKETKMAALLYMAMLAEEHAIIDDIFTLECTVEESNGALSNGDTIQITAKVNRDLLKSYGLRTFKEEYTIVYEIGKDTPKLPEPTTIDIFSHIDVSAEGPDGYAKVYVRVPDTPIPMDEPIDGVCSVSMEYVDSGGWGDAYLVFYLLDENGEEIKREGLVIAVNDQNPADLKKISNGEKIAVQVKDTEDLENCGIFVSGTEKTITPKNLRGLEEIDLLGCLEYEFCGPDGTGYLQFRPGTYTIPVNYAANGEESLNVEVTLDSNYHLYDDYSWISPAILNLTVYPTASEEMKVRITVFSKPNQELKNGDSVTFLIDDWSSSTSEEKMKEAGYTIRQERTETVSGLLTPVELKLSDILDYTVGSDETGAWTLAVGTSKTTMLPENDLGIQKLVTTLKEESPGSALNYTVTFAFTTTDAEGKTEEHSIESEIRISLNKYYGEVKFELVRKKYRDLWTYGFVIPETYEIYKLNTLH